MVHKKIDQLIELINAEDWQGLCIVLDGFKGSYASLYLLRAVSSPRCEFPLTTVAHNLAIRLVP